MRKTSLYMRKRRALITDGVIKVKHPMSLMWECRTFNDEDGTDENARVTLKLVFDAYERMCQGTSTSTDDFDYLAHAVGVTEVRLGQMGGDKTVALAVISDANAGLTRAKNRYIKWHKLELDKQAITHVGEALDMYKTVLLESSPRLMANAVGTRLKVLAEVARHD